jgi:hypothetical protein
VTLTATPADGYRFAAWQGGAGCDGQTDNPLELTVTESTTCAATFIRRFVVLGQTSGAPASVVVAAAAPNATLPVCDGPSCQVDVGAEVVLTAPLDVPGWVFTGWSGDCDEASNIVSISSVQDDLVCTATYGKLLLVSGNPSVAGAVISASSANRSCVGGSCSVLAGEDVEFRVDASWLITGTTGQGCALATDANGSFVRLSSVQSEGQSCSINVVPFTDIVLDATPAGFATVDFTSQGGLQCSAAADGSSAHCSGAISSSVTIHAAASIFIFNSWSGASCPVAGSTNSTETFLPPAGKVACTAIFELVLPP